MTSLEGLLFPDTYQVSNAESEGQVIERMIALMERVADQEDIVRPRSAALGRTPYEMLIIASMIEREAKVDEDRAKIARVIYNRLAFLGMPLQIDATRAVRRGDQAGRRPDVCRSRPSAPDRHGPYNTYLTPGLPPTPIANPGRASIEAALNPAPNPPAGDPICADAARGSDPVHYLYYVLADEDGGHAFAATPEQHEANVQRRRGQRPAGRMWTPRRRRR